MKSIQEYKKTTHHLLNIERVEDKCGKIFIISKTMVGFYGDSKFYISSIYPLNDGSDSVAVRKTQEDVVLYIENEEWKDYDKMISRRELK